MLKIYKIQLYILIKFFHEQLQHHIQVHMLLFYPSLKRKLYITIFFQLMNDMNRAKATPACTVNTENNSISEVLRPPFFKKKNQNDKNLNTNKIWNK